MYCLKNSVLAEMFLKFDLNRVNLWTYCYSQTIICSSVGGSAVVNDQKT